MAISRYSEMKNYKRQALQITNYKLQITITTMSVQVHGPTYYFNASWVSTWEFQFEPTFSQVYCLKLFKLSIVLST